MDHAHYAMMCAYKAVHLHWTRQHRLSPSFFPWKILLIGELNVDRSLLQEHVEYSSLLPQQLLTDTGTQTEEIASPKEMDFVLHNCELTLNLSANLPPNKSLLQDIITGAFSSSGSSSVGMFQVCDSPTLEFAEY